MDELLVANVQRPFGYHFEALDRDRPVDNPPDINRVSILDREQLSDFERQLSDTIAISTDLGTEGTGSSPSVDRQGLSSDHEAEYIHVHQMATHTSEGVAFVDHSSTQPLPHMSSSSLGHQVEMAFPFANQPGQAPHATGEPYNLPHLIHHSAVHQTPTYHSGMHHPQVHHPQIHHTPVTHAPMQQCIRPYQTLIPESYAQFDGHHGFTDDDVHQQSMHQPVNGLPSPSHTPGQQSFRPPAQLYSYGTNSYGYAAPAYEYGSDPNFRGDCYVATHPTNAAVEVTGSRATWIDELERERSAPNTQPNTQPPSPRKLHRTIETNPEISVEDAHKDDRSCVECNSEPQPHLFGESRNNQFVTVELKEEVPRKRGKKAQVRLPQDIATPPSGNRRRSGKQNLTIDQKKKNHNDSEKARRSRLGLAFKDLYRAAPLYHTGNSQNGRLVATELWIEDIHSELQKLQAQLDNATGQKNWASRTRSLDPSSDLSAL